MKRLLIVLFGFLSVSPALASAALTPVIIPTATGTYNQWVPNSGSTHYTTVDEASCNGTTDYVATSTTAKRDSYTISLTSIPSNSLITAIAITPCASRAASGGGSATMNAFYRYAGVDSADQGSYAVTGTTPVALATTTYSNLSLVKTSTSTLEIGAVYTSGTKGVRLSRITVQLTYGEPPSATTSAASSIASTSALLNGTANPNGTTTSAWFRISTSTPGTCNDTFGNLLGTTSLGAGTSSVSYSATSTGLRPDTTYYYCAIASSGYGNSYGSIQSFTTDNAVTTVSSGLATSTTWSPYGGVYVVTGEIYVYDGQTLTIEPGTIVKFNGTGAGLYVEGTLNAEGTASEPIYFTSYKDDDENAGGDTNGDATSTTPAAGNWKFIKLESGGVANFDHSVVRYGGAGIYTVILYNNGGILTFTNSDLSYSTAQGIYSYFGTTTVSDSLIHHLPQGVFLQDQSNTTITDNIFEDNTYGIYGSYGAGAASLTVATNTFKRHASRPMLLSLNTGVVFTHYDNIATSTGANGIEMYANITEDTTWTRDEMPYVIPDGNMTVNSGVTLTIDPGVIVKLGGNYSGITVEGTLVAVGTSPYPIYFTSLKDDTIGGDTNGNGTSTSPAAGNWNTLKFSSASVANLVYTIIKYGGTSAGSSMMLWNNGGLLTVSTSTIANSHVYGIYHGSGTTTVTQSEIKDNTSYGIYNATGNWLNAEKNYWGALNGPYNFFGNPFGDGDSVSDNVDFDPWLGQDNVHYVHESFAVSIADDKLRWAWGATSSQTFLNEWNVGVDAWDALGGVDLVEATSTVDVEVWEIDNVIEDRAFYIFNGVSFEIDFNKAYMEGDPQKILEKTTTHELGHALGLHHSYWGNIMYAASSTQDVFGEQDTADYDYCWVDNTQCVE